LNQILCYSRPVEKTLRCSVRPNSRLDITHKSAVNALNAGQATISATRRDGRGLVHLTMLRKERGATHGVHGLDLTVAQAVRLRAILDEAIRSAIPDDAALDGIPEVDSAARGAADGARPHAVRRDTEAA
jgi:hypothetical protein